MGAVPKVAIAGNPNTGKTTLFNRLTGLQARVGNYPGVTVERQSGKTRLSRSGAIEVLDVPGTYSLTARSAEEQLAIQAICGLHPLERPDAVVVVVDATQLARNLYLVLQVIETDVPVLVALNMVDMLAGRGVSIDVAALARELGVPAVAISAKGDTGVAELKQALDALLHERLRGRPGPRWFPATEALKADIDAVAAALPKEWEIAEPRRRNALALWALLSLDEHDENRSVPAPLRAAAVARRALAGQAGREIESEVIRGRYEWIDAHTAKFLQETKGQPPSLTDRIDRVVLHPRWGFVLFLAVMALVFQALFLGADPIISIIERGVGALKGAALGVLPQGVVSNFVGDALIEGVGSVVMFLPQIMLLFLFIGAMEDLGYMARVALLMDRLMKVVGLHGRAFVPMMSGFACAVPAILATRTMERQRDRFLTMMVVPLMSCSARLPVYALIIAAMFPPRRVLGVVPIQGLLMVGMYVFSTAAALVVAAVLGRTVFKGPRVPFLLELPPYRVPHWSSVFAMMWRRSKVFLTQAGTFILAVTVVMWVLLSFPRSEEVAQQFDARRTKVTASVPAGTEQEGQLKALENEREARQLEHSFGGRLGKAMEPVIRPLGFDWKIGVGLLGAFAAREVFVSTLGVVYGMGKDDEGAVGLRERLRSEAGPDGKPLYSPLMGMSLMVFFALACQCTSTLAVVRRETRSFRWPAFLFVYTVALAWLSAFLVYQGGRLLGFA